MWEISIKSNALQRVLYGITKFFIFFHPGQMCYRTLPNHHKCVFVCLKWGLLLKSNSMRWSSTTEADWSTKKFQSFLRKTLLILMEFFSEHFYVKLLSHPINQLTFQIASINTKNLDRRFCRTSFHF
jgi:hypothetical protein